MDSSLSGTWMYCGRLPSGACQTAVVLPGVLHLNLLPRAGCELGTGLDCGRGLYHRRRRTTSGSAWSTYLPPGTGGAPDGVGRDRLLPL